ncbi:MAG: IPT/TIG domain-containing protein [Acidobacteriota bacterium]|nr:IPT/TIG domain-containing protein [Acidobacteriota bacterium]
MTASGFSSGPPFQASPSQPLTLAVSASRAATGNSTIEVKGTSGNLTHSISIAALVSAAIDFQLNVSPTTLTIGPNGEASAQVTLIPGANFGSSSVYLNYPSVHVGNTGVDMHLSSQFLTAAQPNATVNFQSGFQVATGSISAPLTGTLGAQVINLSLTLNVTNPASACNSHLRSTMRRADADASGVVYDPVHKLVFAAVQQLNTVQVYSSTTAQTVATIPVPEPWQMDITPDGSRILVGTFTNYMYWIDPVSLKVVNRVNVPAPLQSGNLGISAPQTQPIALANGKILVLRGTYPPQEWDPSTNVWRDPTPTGLSNPNTLIRRSADHSKVVVANSNGLAIFDSASDSYGAVQQINASAIALNSNGSELAVLSPSPTLPGGDQVETFDQNFNVLASYQINSNSVGYAIKDDLIFSRDDSTLFLHEGDDVTALSATDLSFLGQAPSPGSRGAGFGEDIDETNMIFSPGAGKSAQSTAFTDAASPCALGTDLPVNIAVTPPQGTQSAPAPVSVTAVQGITSQSLVYFGAAPGSPQAAPGTNLAPNPPTSIQVTPPAALSPGAVNVTVTNPDGSMTIAPDAFSYGSTVLAVATNSGPPTGGTPVTVFGYGLAFDASAIQVKVGGNAATVTQAFVGAGISPFPFPLDQVTFTTPAGNPGPADIAITTPAGSATVVGGFHYLQSAQLYPSSVAFAQAVYDKSRQRLYASAVNSNVVDVFDLSAKQFLTPIQVGNAPQGLAMSPDSKTLIVSNTADATISIVDLAGLSPTKTVSVVGLPNLPAQCGQPVPYAVVTTDNNQAVVGLFCSTLEAGALEVFDLGTQSFVGCGSSQGCTAMMTTFPPQADNALMIVGSPDGSTVLLWNGVGFGKWDVNADTFTSQSSGGSSLPYRIVQAAVAADKTALALGYAVVEPSLDLYSMMQEVVYLKAGLNDTNAVAGEKLHPSGALLYVPEANGFSIYDAHRARLYRRVALPQQIAATYDAMAIDETGSRVFLLGANGLIVVNIADLPLSIGNLQPAQGTAAGGTEVVIRGSGFQNGAQVFFDNTQATTQFIDSSTLHVTSPGITAGGVRITVVNPDGSSYSLDDAFSAQ